MGPRNTSNCSYYCAGVPLDYGMRDNRTTTPTQLPASRLYDEHAPSIRAYLRSRSPCHFVADDITSEVFVAVTRLLSTRPNEVITRAWLMTVAKRRLVDHWRAEGRRHRLRVALESAESARPQPTEETALSGEVDLLLSGVPDRQRAALSLRHLGGFSVGEVAEQMDLSYQGTESLLARGRRSMASNLRAA